MKKQLEQTQIFHDLHRSGNPLILVNAWDAGSARIVQETGA
jgi:2-methylisocitrate lyase-like PEP mutase family enzyme